MKHFLSILLYLSVLLPVEVRAQEGTVVKNGDVVSRLKYCGSLIKEEKLEETRKVLDVIDASAYSEAYKGYVRFYHMSLCYHRGMSRYNQKAYAEAALLATEGLKYYIGSTAKATSWVHLTKLLGDCAYQTSDFKSAKKAYTLIRDVTQQLCLTENYAQSLTWIAKADKAMGHTEEALAGFTKSYELLYEQRSTQTHHAAFGLYSLYKHTLFNEEKAALWKLRETEAQSKFSKKKSSNINFGKCTYFTLASMKKNSSKSLDEGRKQEAIDIVSEWISGAEASHEADSILLAEGYWWRASFEYLSGKDVSCMKDLRKALKLINHHNDGNRELLYRIWDTTAGCLYHSKLYEKALNANKQAIGNAKLVYGANSFKMADLYMGNVRYALGIKDYKLQLDNLCKANSILKTLVTQNFAFLDKQERTSYWRRLRNYTNELPNIILRNGDTSDSYVDTLYQNVLFSKGLLLNTDIEERANVNRDMSFLKTSVDDIRKALPPRSVAIEFCESVDILDTTLCALIIRNKTNHPLFVPLCKPSQALATSKNIDSLHNIVWSKIMPYLHDIDNIYFSPVSVLNILPIECGFSNNVNLYRVSSTRVLAEHRKKRIGNKIVLYGGLSYDITISEMGADLTKTKTDAEEKFRGAVEDIVPLPGSKTEIDDIANVARLSNLITEMYSGEQGTETSFKALNADNVKAIHIATHGFAIPRVRDNSTKALLTRMRKGDDDILNEFEAMKNSGLLFAGAQNAYNGEEIPLGTNDGTLTTNEISSLDFSNVDLITLSACETAKGDITGDGVFGLQRGFKLAGAQSILMSLWKVDDAATCKLMTEFYTNWISKKMTKHDALEAAKKTVRETKGWEDPKYWAAFILLDGLY